MTSQPTPAVPELAELRTRNLAFTRKLLPIIGELRALAPERAELVRLGDLLYPIAEAASSRDDWLREGEESFFQRSGRADVADALWSLHDVVDAIAPGPSTPERTDDTAGEVPAPGGDEPGQGWIPEVATAGAAEVQNVLLEGRAWDIRTHADRLRHAITGVFLAAPAAYAAGESFDDQQASVAALLGRALLEVSVTAEEATERLGSSAR